MVGVDGLAGSEAVFAPLVSEAETREKWCGSLLSKQGRSGLVEDDWRGLKITRTDDNGLSKSVLMQSKNPSLLRSSSLFPNEQQQQLLSFSSLKADSVVIGTDGFIDRSYQNAILPCYHPTSIYGRNAGFGFGNLNGNVHCGAFAGLREPFAPSQWMELEQQALVYKYINSNVPIPSNLLIPSRKSFNLSGLSALSAESLRPNSLGYGSFHLGFSGKADPELGRCRRTDGKKWRCSRDAVADHKYCERHMNRGRQRSRKPVEGHSGHASSGNTAAAIKGTPAITSSSALAVPSHAASNCLTITQQQMKSLQPGVDYSSNHMSRILVNKMNASHLMQDSQSLSILSSEGKKAKDTLFPNPKQQIPFEDSSRLEFGFVPSNSLLNPHQTTYDLNDQETQSHPLCHFTDDWPKNQSDGSAVSLPQAEEIQSDRTQLSISLPVGPLDFSSSFSSPTQERLTLSPLKLSRKLDPIQMGLGVGGFHESTQRQANWIPISWETSMGGPLGEVLKSTNNIPTDCKHSSSTLDLMTEGWNSSSQIGSFPTGVLEKTTFGSSSNSSTWSSPRTAISNIRFDKILPF